MGSVGLEIWVLRRAVVCLRGHQRIRRDGGMLCVFFDLLCSLLGFGIMEDGRQARMSVVIYGNPRVWGVLRRKNAVKVAPSLCFTSNGLRWNAVKYLLDGWAKCLLVASGTEGD